MTEDTKLEITPYDMAALVRYCVEKRRNQDRIDTKSGLMKSLQATFRDIWPKCSKKRALRISIMSALLGKPISSFADLSMGEAYAVMEVICDTKYTIASAATWLQELVEGPYFGTAWIFPSTRPDEGDLRRVLDGDGSGSGRDARGFDNERTSDGNEEFIVFDISSMQYSDEAQNMSTDNNNDQWS